MYNAAWPGGGVVRMHCKGHVVSLTGHSLGSPRCVLCLGLRGSCRLPSYMVSHMLSTASNNQP